MDLKTSKIGLSVATTLATAAISVASVFGATPAGAANSSKFCTDYTHAAKVSTLKQIKAAIPVLKKLENEAPGSLHGEIGQFVGYVQILVKHKGKLTPKSKETAFEKLSTKIAAETSKLCK